MKVQAVLVIILLLGSFILPRSQSCLADGIVFSRQGQIDSFVGQYSGCVHIVGDVKIKEAASKSIRNLEGLSLIRSIGGDLIVSNNHSLMNPMGFSKLEFIGGNFAVFENDAFINLNGLDQLRKIGGSFLVKGNKSLSDFGGANKLDTILGDLGIVMNESLDSFKGFDSLSVVGVNFILRDNSSLKNLRGLERLTSVGKNMSVRDHPFLITLEGMNNLRSIGGYLDVSYNASLKDLHGLDSLTFIGDNLRVEYNGSLESLSGLENLKIIKGFVEVHDNPMLNGTSGLEHLSPEKVIELKREKSGTHKIWVQSKDKSNSWSGYLRELNDSTIVVSNFLSSTNANYLVRNMDVRMIETLKFRKQNSVGIGMLIGALSGFALGGLLGWASGDDSCSKGSFICFSAVDKALIAGIPLGAAGMIIGGISGSASIKFPINQDQTKYIRIKGHLMEYQLGDR